MEDGCSLGAAFANAIFKMKSISDSHCCRAAGGLCGVSAKDISG